MVSRTPQARSCSTARLGSNLQKEKLINKSTKEWWDECFKKNSGLLLQSLFTTNKCKYFNLDCNTSFHWLKKLDYFYFTRMCCLHRTRKTDVKNVSI